jgi:hypothetical protein
MAAYTTPDAIAAYLATTLTPEQTTQATLASDAVTVWIDHRTGRSWQASGPITGELRPVEGTYVYLEHPPVSSVETVELRLGVNDYETLNPSQYELIDPAAGLLQMIGGYGGSVVRVAYTTGTEPLPADLAYAATVLASDLLSPTLDPDLSGVDQVSVGQNDVSLHFAAVSSTVEGGASAAVSVVDSYRRVVIA